MRSRMVSGMFSLGESVTGVPSRTRRGARATVLALALWSLATAGFAQAAALERDLGEGLMYFRVHRVPDDLPTNDSVRQHPCVLDLRYAHGNADAATILAGWIKFHATTRNPVFILVNGSTGAELLPAFAHRDNTAGTLVIGVAAQRFEPDFTVHESAATERRAYEALEKGATVAALTTDNPDKQRNDEASLAQNRTADTGDEDTTAAADGDETLPAKPKGPPIDAALQEAIHLQRGLQAMK